MRVIGAVVVAGLLVVAAAGADWPQFRGPEFTGVANESGLPLEWSKDKNMAWIAPLPGPGASSPITSGGKIYITCYTGYGVERDNAGSQGNLKRHLLCLDEATGNEVWKREIAADSTPEANFQGQMTQHGYATNTPTTDGKRIYVYLGTAGAFAFDLEGNQLWNTKLGTGTDGWGSGASPIVYEDLLIVPATIEAQSIVALKSDSGDIAWRTPVPKRSWGTPALVNVEGKKELVVSSQGKVLGLDPRSGSELWTCAGIEDYVCPSVVPGDGVAYCTGARANQMLAVKCGGKGDVTSTHVLWKQRIGANVTTPVLVGEHLYGVKENGAAYCVNTADGKVVFEGQRLTGGGNAPLQPAPMPGGRRRGGRGFGGGASYASVVAAGDKLYAVTSTGVTHVLAAGPEFKSLAKNAIEDDGTDFDATPAISNGKLLMRSNKALYCIATK